MTGKFTKASIASAALVLGTQAAMASNWHFAWVGNKEVRYFFDVESIERAKDIIIVWIKTVQMSQPDTDGSWASAMRWRFNCPKKTIQSLAISFYDREGKFLRSGTGGSTESVVIPDSTGEAMLKIACKPGFPNDKSGDDYFRVENNDVFQATKNYADMLNSKIDSAPK